MRWRPYRGHPQPAPVALVEGPFGDPPAVLVEGMQRRAERRAAARDAAAWVLTHTETPTRTVLDAYLDALDDADRVLDEAVPS